jgi:hypothetical protein
MLYQLEMIHDKQERNPQQKRFALYGDFGSNYLYHHSNKRDRQTWSVTIPQLQGDHYNDGDE